MSTIKAKQSSPTAAVKPLKSSKSLTSKPTNILYGGEAAKPNKNSKAASSIKNASAMAVLRRRREAERALANKKKRLAAGRDFRMLLPERLTAAMGDVLEVNITDARAQMPRMVKSSAQGRVFVIGNAKNTNDAPAVLIGMDELQRVVHEAARPVRHRTLGDILNGLPFSGMDLPEVRPQPLQGDGIPTAILPW